MKSPHLLRVLTLAGLGSLATVPALAQEPGFFYGGVSAGTAILRCIPTAPSVVKPSDS